MNPANIQLDLELLLPSVTSDADPCIARLRSMLDAAVVSSGSTSATTVSLVLRWAGIDSAEDLDDARLRAKWNRGRAVLEDRIGHLAEERYLSGGGIIISGTAPTPAP